jgi:hypothetical protein
VKSSQRCIDPGCLSVQLQAKRQKLMEERRKTAELNKTPMPVEDDMEESDEVYAAPSHLYGAPSHEWRSKSCMENQVICISHE